MEATGLGPHDTRVPKSLVYHQPNAFWELLFLTSLFSANAEGSDSKSQNPLGLGRRGKLRPDSFVRRDWRNGSPNPVREGHQNKSTFRESSVTGTHSTQ